MKNKLTRKQKLEKKSDKYSFWRNFYIIPLMGSTLLSTTATLISLLTSFFTGSFAITGILALISLCCASASIAGYKLNPIIDAKFYNKLLEIRSELEKIDNEENQYHSPLPVKANEDEIVTAKEDLFGNVKIHKVNEKQTKKIEKEEYKNIDYKNFDL